MNSAMNEAGDTIHRRQVAAARPASQVPGIGWRRRLAIALRVTVLLLLGIPTVRCASAAPQISDEQIDSVGDTIMQDRDFRSMRRRLRQSLPAADADKGFLNSLSSTVGEALRSIIAPIEDFLGWLFSSGSRPRRGGSSTSTGPATGSGSPFSLQGIGRLLTVLMIVAILAILILVATIVVKSRDRQQRTAVRLPEIEEENLTDLAVPPGELGVSVYEARAIQLAEQGNYRSAVRELLVGAMSWIERGRLIRYRRGLTNRDYLRAIWRQPERRNAFGTIALAFEWVYFGRRVATRQMFDHCLMAFQGAFRAEEAVSTAG